MSLNAFIENQKEKGNAVVSVSFNWKEKDVAQYIKKNNFIMEINKLLISVKSKNGIKGHGAD